VSAGYVSEGIVLVDLLAYLTGAQATSTFLRLHKTRTVQSVVIDAHSPGATLIKPLTDAAVTVTRPSASDVAVAYSRFLDGLATGRLSHALGAPGRRGVRHRVRAGGQPGVSSSSAGRSMALAARAPWAGSSSL
jgi:hypothetical protein